MTPWTEARQAPLPMGFSRQEYWSGWPCPPPGDLPNPGIKPRSPASQADSLLSEPPGKPIYITNTHEFQGPVSRPQLLEDRYRVPAGRMGPPEPGK